MQHLLLDLLLRCKTVKTNRWIDGMPIESWRCSKMVTLTETPLPTKCPCCSTLHDIDDAKRVVIGTTAVYAVSCRTCSTRFRLDKRDGARGETWTPSQGATTPATTTYHTRAIVGAADKSRSCTPEGSSLASWRFCQFSHGSLDLIFFMMNCSVAVSTDTDTLRNLWEYCFLCISGSYHSTHSCITISSVSILMMKVKYVPSRLTAEFTRLLFLEVNEPLQ